MHAVNQVVGLVLQHLTRALIRRPWLGMALVAVAAVAVTAVAIQGANSTIILIAVLLWISAIGLGLTGRTVQRHAEQVEEARSTLGVVPPPRWFVGNSFWFFAAFALAIVVAAGFIAESQLARDDVEIRAGATVTDVQFSHRNFNNRFYEVDVQFLSPDGDEMTGSFVRMGAPDVGDTSTIAYDPIGFDGTVNEVAPSSLWVAGIVGGTTMGLLGSGTAWSSRPRRTDPNLTLARVPGMETLVKRAHYQASNGDEAHHLIYSDNRWLRVWTGGEWTIDSLQEWLRSGGIPSDDATSHADMAVATLTALAVHNQTLTIEGLTSQGKATSVRLKVGNHADRLLNELAHHFGWHVQQADIRLGGKLGAYRELLSILAFLSPLVFALGLLMVEPERMNQWLTVGAVTVAAPAVVAVVLIVVGRRKLVTANAAGPAISNSTAVARRLVRH